MKNSQHSKVMCQKAFYNENDAFNYYFLLQDALVMNGYEFVPSSEVNYNASTNSFPICDLKKGYRLFKIYVKLIRLF